MTTFSHDEVRDLINNMVFDGPVPGLEGAVLQCLNLLQVALPSTDVTVNDGKLVVISTKVGNFILPFRCDYEDPALKQIKVFCSHAEA